MSKTEDVSNMPEKATEKKAIAKKAAEKKGAAKKPSFFKRE